MTKNLSSNSSPSRFQRWTNNYFVSFLCWLIALGLALLDILYGRPIVVAFFGLFGLNHWVMSFIDRAGIFLLGLAGMVLVLFLEHYYRTGAARNILWPRFARVSAIQLLIIVVSLLITWLQSA